MKKQVALFCISAAFATGGYAEWSYDSSAQTITDGTWVLNVSTINNSTNLRLGKGGNGDAINSTNAGSGDLDLSGFEGDTGRKILQVRSNAFKSVSVVSSLVIPDVTTIEANAFNSCKLTNIVISADFSNPGNSIFYAAKLQDISPRTFTKITSITTSMFASCSALKGRLSFPNATVVNTGAFNGSALEHLEFSENLRSIGNEAFRSCASLTNIVPQNMPNLNSIGDNCYYGASVLQGDFVFPKIPILRGFRNAVKITSIVATNATKIGSACFYDCKALTNCQFSVNATNLEGNCFYNCTSLKSITALLPDTVYALGGGIYGCSKLAMPMRIANPRLTVLPSACFRGSMASIIGDVEIYSPITTIAAQAFQGSKQGQVFNFYADNAPSSVAFNAFNAGGGNGYGRLGVYIRVHSKSALAGWRALCTKTAPDEISSMNGYPGAGTVGVAVDSGYNHWIIDATPPSGTIITVM